MFFNDTLVAVKRPLLVPESESPLPELFSLIAATSKAEGEAAAEVGACGDDGAEVWPKDVTACNAVAMSNSFARKDNSKAICLVDMDAMLLLAWAHRAGYTDENLVEFALVHCRCHSDFGCNMVHMKQAANGDRAAALKASSEAVDAYIAAVPEPNQTALLRLREIIRSAAPKEAVEVISYGIPAFALSKAFFGYAAFKNHLAVLPFSGSLFNSFTEELKPYTRTKSSLHLPFDQPLPGSAHPQAGTQSSSRHTKLRAAGLDEL
jgi:uncharacterized protein YdhG (YjbR/CyaY superfamily)